jgi:CRP/FNR family transcriptional regulator, cyclic AMP receptor protein
MVLVTSEAAQKFLSAPLLADLDLASRQAVLEELEERHEPKGAMLLQQDEQNNRMNFLIDGTVTVVRSYPKGRDEMVATLTAPSVFGETSFFRPSAAIVSVRATSPVWLLTLDRKSYDRLRQQNLPAAEKLALAAVRFLAERFDMLDKRISDYMAQHPEGHPRATEWSNFRARLFEESLI